jgi:hypothetical protein
MTDFGLRCWDSKGRVTLNLEDTISRLRYKGIAGTNQTGSIILPDIVGKSVVAFSQPAAAPDPIYTATTFPHGYHEHSVEIKAGGKVFWAPLGVSHKPNATSTILVFIYD